MRRPTFFVLATAAAWLLLFAAPALADNGPHVIGAGLTPDSCAGCHRLHTAPAPHLLKQDGTQLCYTCHGTSGTGASTDVEDGVQYNAAARPPGATPVGALRGGGFAYALIDSGNPAAYPAKNVPVLSAGEPTTSAHSVGPSATATIWGNTPDSQSIPTGKTLADYTYGAKNVELRCASCHDPHGNGYYRILRPKPKDSGIYRSSTANGGIGILDVSTKLYTTTNYWSVNDANTTVPAPPFTGSAPAVGPTNLDFNNGIAQWCSTCHTRYLTVSGSSGPTTDSGDPIFRYRHTSSNSASNGRNCIQCHVAHGTNATVSGPHSSAVGNPDPTDPTVGSSKLLRINNRGVCQVCHNK